MGFFNRMDQNVANYRIGIRMKKMVVVPVCLNGRCLNNLNSFEMATRSKISLDKEKITKLIKDVFKEEFKKQEVNITNIISSNFTLTMKEKKV